MCGVGNRQNAEKVTDCKEKALFYLQFLDV